MCATVLTLQPPGIPPLNPLFAISCRRFGCTLFLGETLGDSKTKGTPCSASELLKMSLLSAGVLQEEVVEITR